MAKMTFIEEIEWVIENLDEPEAKVIAFAQTNDVQPAIVSMWRYYRPKDGKTPDQTKLWDLYNRLASKRFEKYEADRASREQDLTDEHCVKIARRFLEKTYGPEFVEPVYADHGQTLGRDMLRDCAEVAGRERRVPAEPAPPVREGPATPGADAEVVPQ